MRLSGRKWYGTGEGPFDPLPPAPPALRNLGLETRLVGVSRENQIKRPPPLWTFAGGPEAGGNQACKVIHYPFCESNDLC